ncbi:DNA primase family protein [Enterococcus termitis]|uniref:DNA primase n=1 Tax=Enterococcus termitis TaxID=332950 RepID=A0A1E5GIE8_9ENTE|nr:DNA primase family protein [Enterococcus termitis]OEG12478.1 DNA primase [Enterococcus termitis]OJG96692.1 phage/plasmid primase, P4 family domain protein [Enterococcus termitis]
MQRPKDEITPQVSFDGELNLSLASTKTEKRWKNRTMKWSEFLQRLQTPTITQETAADYAAMPKSRRDDIKDVGGFVGGFLKEGKRKRGNAEMRSLVTLDADSTTADLWEAVNLLFDHAAAIYTTHSHTSKKPRYRLIFPLSRPVTAEEYEPLARKLAEMFGMDNFDDTTYQPERLMYWASRSLDGEYFTDYQDLSWVDPDEILSEYVDWKDSSFWPESSRGHSIRERQAKKAGDPLEKKGVVGAFCRSYDIVAAIEKFLPEIYGPTMHPDRYTFLGGSTSGGLVIYDDKFAYSHHGTDPVGDQLVNAFDLVRIHLYGDLDEDVKAGTPPQKMKSYQAMNEWLQEDEAIISQMRKERLGDALDDFSGVDLEVSDEAIETNWLTFDARGLPDINTYLLAQEVASEIPFFYNGSEFLRYDSAQGIWRSGADEFIKSYLTNRKLLKESKIRYINECIASIKNLVFVEKDLNETNVNKLVLANGVYDLKENSFTLGFDKELYARNSHPVVYDASAKCPVFDGYLQHVVGPENVDFVYEWFGYNFYREYKLQKLLFLHGRGGTGKSTLVNILKQLLGSDSYSAVSLKSLMTERFAPAWLYSKTANFDTDAKPEYLADGSLLKQLTGEDTIYADRKNLDPIFFYNYAKLTFAMNELPAMRDFTGGLRRRVIILSIDKELTSAVKKKYPLAVMQQEGAGIFNKAMQGLRNALERNAFSLSKEMDEHLLQWIQGNDVLSLFIQDECETGPDKKTPVSEAYSDYVTYCKGSGYKQMTRNKFKTRMEELGFENKAVKIAGKSVKCWVGVDTGNGTF